jgi:hypothetical protein
VESGTYGEESTKISGSKELIGKIFRTKDLVSGTVVPGRYAQRVSYIGSSGAAIGGKSRLSVTDER